LDLPIQDPFANNSTMSSDFHLVMLGLTKWKEQSIICRGRARARIARGPIVSAACLGFRPPNDEEQIL